MKKVSLNFMKKSTNNIYGIKKIKNKFVERQLGYNIFSHKHALSIYKDELLNTFLAGFKQDRVLKEFDKKNIDFLINNKSYRGSRHKKHLPVRGQRTHTNAKTIKKKSNAKHNTEKGDSKHKSSKKQRNTKTKK